VGNSVITINKAFTKNIFKMASIIQHISVSEEGESPQGPVTDLVDFSSLRFELKGLRRYKAVTVNVCNGLNNVIKIRKCISL
jgi:hypothetical protein